MSKDKRCQRVAAHIPHVWWGTDWSHPQYFCKGVTTGAAPPQGVRSESTIHDPNVNCDCEPNSAYPRARCEYRTLADAVIDNLPVADGDASELALLVDAVDAIGGALRALRTPPRNGGA